MKTSKKFQKAIDSKELIFSELINSGNTKLPEDTAIMNIAPAIFCPAKALNLCKLCNKDGSICYGIADEIFRKSIFNHILQTKLFQSIDAETFAKYFNRLNSKKRNKFNKFRFDEVGDFHNSLDVSKLAKIAQLVPNVKFYTYTKRKDLNLSELYKSNVTVNGSFFMASNNFKPVNEIPSQLADNEVVCPGSCRKCSYCADLQGFTIYTKARTNRFIKKQTINKYMELYKSLYSKVLETEFTVKY